MNNVEKMLVDLSPYHVCCQWIEGCILVSVRFDEQWEVIEPADERIAYKRQGENHLYCAHMGDVSVSDVFNAIMSTVEYNQELKKKSDLLNIKIQELYELFANEDLETLKTLVFKVSKRQQKKSKKRIADTESQVEPTDAIDVNNTNSCYEGNKEVEPLEEI